MRQNSIISHCSDLLGLLTPHSEGGLYSRSAFENSTRSTSEALKKDSVVLCDNDVQLKIKKPGPLATQETTRIIC